MQQHHFRQHATIVYLSSPKSTFRPGTVGPSGCQGKNLRSKSGGTRCHWTKHVKQKYRITKLDWIVEYPWMKEEKGIIHRGEGAHLRCLVSTTVQFSLRNEGSSEYMCLCEGRESLCPNFQTFQDPRHQFHGIDRLVSGLLFRGLFITTYAGGNDSWEIFALLKGTVA